MNQSLDTFPPDQDVPPPHELVLALDPAGEQTARQLGVATRHNVDSLAMPLQPSDGPGSSARHFLRVAVCQPSKCRSVRPYQVETLGINFFEWNGAVHRGFGQRADLGLATGAACQFVNTFNAGEGAVAVETHRAKFRVLRHHRVNCTTCRMAGS